MYFFCGGFDDEASEDVDGVAIGTGSSFVRRLKSTVADQIDVYEEQCSVGWPGQ